jgi:DNA-binding XRE family transcriptional regulator
VDGWKKPSSLIRISSNSKTEEVWMYLQSEELKELRRSWYFSQYQLSKLSGVSRYNIGLFEQGYRSLSKWEMKQILSVFLSARCHLDEAESPEALSLEDLTYQQLLRPQEDIDDVTVG